MYILIDKYINALKIQFFIYIIMDGGRGGGCGGGGAGGGDPSGPGPPGGTPTHPLFPSRRGRPRAQWVPTPRPPPPGPKPHP